MTRTTLHDGLIFIRHKCAYNVSTRDIHRIEKKKITRNFVTKILLHDARRFYCDSMCRCPIQTFATSFNRTYCAESKSFPRKFQVKFKAMKLQRFILDLCSVFYFHARCRTHRHTQRPRPTQTDEQQDMHASVCLCACVCGCV